MYHTLSAYNFLKIFDMPGAVGKHILIDTKGWNFWPKLVDGDVNDGLRGPNVYSKMQESRFKKIV